MKKKFLFTLLVVGTSLQFASGCNSTNDNKDPVEEGATKITIYAREFEKWSKDHLTSLVREFNKDLNDGIQVTVNFFTQNNYPTALTTSRENHRAPDLYMSTYAELYNSHIQGNHAAPIEDYLSSEAINDLIPAYKEMCTYNDHLYAYPWNVEPGSLFFYRKDMLEAAGVSAVPKTFEELYAACKKLIDSGVIKKGQYCCGLPLGSYETTWVTYGLQQNTTGGLVLEDDWKTLRIHEGESAAGFKSIAEFFYKMFSENYCPTSAITSEGYTYIVDALCDDSLAMTYSGSWGFAEIYDYLGEDSSLADKIGVAPIPTLDGDQTKCTSANGGWCYVLSQESKHKDLAAKFLNWMFTENVQRTAEYFIKAHYSKAATSTRVQNYLKTTKLNVPQDWFDTCNDVASKGIPEATFPWEVGQEFGKVLETMELNCKKGEFNALYASALKSAVDNINVIMSRQSYPENPKYKEDSSL